MRTAAFVTYNTLGDRFLSSGWHDREDRRALVLQNTRGRSWAADQAIAKSSGQYDQECDTVRSEISDLWGQLQEHLHELDIIVIYVGSNGSEHAIALAANLPASKVIFVSCDCNLSAKRNAVQRTGLTEARWIDCECGGHQTMGRLYNVFMRGELLTRAAN